MYIDHVKIGNDSVEIHDSRIGNASFAAVATSGDYDDLINKPTIPTVSANKIFHGTCATAAATAAKVVECEEFTSSDLVAGAVLLVTFSATNSGDVGSLTLNVNSTGAKKIQYINNGTRGNLSNAAYLKASTTYLFVFDGTYWLFLHNYNSNTTYSALTLADANTGTATAARTITAAVLKLTIKTHSPVHDVTVNGESVMNGTTAEITLPSLSGYETTSNKVTSISSSSTDNEYPTAKCVYDIVGNIQTLLLNI